MNFPTTSGNSGSNANQLSNTQYVLNIWETLDGSSITVTWTPDAVYQLQSVDYWLKAADGGLVPAWASTYITINGSQILNKRTDTNSAAVINDQGSERYDTLFVDVQSTVIFYIYTKNIDCSGKLSVFVREIPQSQIEHIGEPCTFGLAFENWLESLGITYDNE